MVQEFKTIKHTTIYFSDQKAGTSGLRKSTRTFQQINYIQNFIQSFLNALDDDIREEYPNNESVSIFVGGDGRYFVPECAEIIIKMCAAHPRINKLYVAQNGLMSTPAVSCCIRKYKTFAGVILTASHNPGGPDNDFGIKFNCANGGPALQALTDKVFTISKAIEEYSEVRELSCDLSKIGEQNYIVDGQDFSIEIVDSVQDYSDLMKEIFDFDALRAFFKSGVKITVNSLNGG